MTQRNAQRQEVLPRTAEEELHHLESEVAFKESLAPRALGQPDRDRIVREKLAEYREQKPEDVLSREFAMPRAEASAVALELAPEAHDRKIEELLGLLTTKGIRNTLSVLEGLRDAHLYDDFHRFLVQYLKAGHPVEGLRPKSDLSRALKMTLYEVLLPEAAAAEDKQKELGALLSGMEQFYAGMLSIAGASASHAENPHFALEIANANGSDEFIVYVAVPDSRKLLLEKQLLSIFPDAKLREAKDDYNIFNAEGAAAASVAAHGNNPIFPLKTYDSFDVDPLNVILNSFSRIDRDGEGAAIQVLVRPQGDFYVQRYKRVLERIRQGVRVKDAIAVPDTVGGEFLGLFKDIISGAPAGKRSDAEGAGKADEAVTEEIKRKMEQPIVSVNVRLVASAAAAPEAEAILRDIESSFNQFETTAGGKLSFKRVRGRPLRSFLRAFSLREFSRAEALPLNLRELTSIFHFPGSPVKAAPELRRVRAASSPAPVGLPPHGTLIGVSKNRGLGSRVFITDEDRLRHLYLIGQTGTGKSTLLKNMIAQDLARGAGLCFIDPHGADLADALSFVPKERFEDVVYFDPGALERPMALNMLEYDARFPEQKTFVVNEMLSIFDKLFDMKVAGGPMFEQYFRNAVLLTIEDPGSGGTLIDVSRTLSDRRFRELKLSRCKNPIVVQFWREVAEKAGGEAALANIVPYITSKFDNFLTNDIMRPIVAQERSSWNFRELMDSQKILLVNLSKGRLGELNANLIGLILVGKLLMAALSRADSLPTAAKALPPFYLYLDEFQNITTSSIATILSEARKYRLSLTVAHQFVKQLDEKIRDAVFGNVGSLVSFRVGPEDGEFLEKQFAPVFRAEDLMNLENRHAYVRLLANGRPAKPFDMETLPPPAGDPSQNEGLKRLSSLKYGRDRAEIEAEIMKRYGRDASSTPASA